MCLEPLWPWMCRVASHIFTRSISSFFHWFISRSLPFAKDGLSSIFGSASAKGAKRLRCGGFNHATILIASVEFCLKLKGLWSFSAQMILPQGLYDWTGWQACKVHQVESKTSTCCLIGDVCIQSNSIEDLLLRCLEIARPHGGAGGDCSEVLEAERLRHHFPSIYQDRKSHAAPFLLRPWLPWLPARGQSHTLSASGLSVQSQYIKALCLRGFRRRNRLNQATLFRSFEFIWISCEKSAVANLAGVGLQLYPRMPINRRPLPRLWAHSPLWPET